MIRNLNSKGVDIHRSTIHEMLHGLGLGHAYGEVGDFMYGLDPIGGGKSIYTCESAQDNYNDNSEPTEFDTRATFYSYGNDGFARPNTDMVHGINDRYYCEPLPCVSSHVSKVTNPPVVKIINPQSPSTKSETDSQQTKKKTTTVTTTIEEKAKILSYLNNYRLLAKLGSLGQVTGNSIIPPAWQ